MINEVYLRFIDLLQVLGSYGCNIEKKKVVSNPFSLKELWIFMANSAQARKRARQAVKRREYNVSLRSKLRTAIKSVRKAIGTGNKELAQNAFNSSLETVDSIAGKGIIHKNKAARYKSRLSAAIKMLNS